MLGSILVLLVLTGGLVWAVLYGPLRDSPLFRPQPKGAQLTPAANQGAVPSKAKTAQVRRGESDPGVQAATAVSGLEHLPTFKAPTAPPPELMFPTAVDVPLGMLGSNIVASFGPPVARTIGVDQDGQREILVYRRSRPDATTFVHLRKGRVVSAVTTAY